MGMNETNEIEETLECQMFDAAIFSFENIDDLAVNDRKKDFLYRQVQVWAELLYNQPIYKYLDAAAEEGFNAMMEFYE